MRTRFQLAQKRFIPLVLIAGGVCLLSSGCGSKATDPPSTGGTAVSQILADPNASAAVKQQAAQQQQMASQMQQKMQQQAKLEEQLQARAQKK